MKRSVFIKLFLLSIIASGCASQAELTARDNFLAAAERSSNAAKLGDKKALSDACKHYREAARLAIKIADAEAALNACELSGNAGNAYSSYLMGVMLRTTTGFYRSTEYEHRYSTHLERDIATAQWFRKAERDGFKTAAEDAKEMEDHIAKSSEKGGSDILGKLAVGAFVAGVANSANISTDAKLKVMTSVASDLASDGSGTATARLLTEQTTQRSNTATSNRTVQSAYRDLCSEHGMKEALGHDRTDPPGYWGHCVEREFSQYQGGTWVRHVQPGSKLPLTPWPTRASACEFARQEQSDFERNYEKMRESGLERSKPIAERSPCVCETGLHEFKKTSNPNGWGCSIFYRWSDKG